MATSCVVSLTDVKAHLGYPEPTAPNSDDASLMRFIAAADEVLAFECDATIPRTYSERFDGGDYKIFLYHRPIVTVQNIEEGWGWINFELDYQDVNTTPGDTTLFGYSIDNYNNGEVSRRSVASVQIPFMAGTKNIFVQYVAGFSPVPATIVLATLELIAHWWQNSQIRGAVQSGANISYDATLGQNYTRDTESGIQNINIGIPGRILEMLKAHRRMPIFA